MDPRLNPYAPGAGTKPPELAGRDDIIDECDIALSRILAGRSARGLLLTGLRGVGKTVLLNVVRDQATRMGYEVDLLEAPEGGVLASQLIPTLRQSLTRLSIKARAGDVVQKALRVLRSFQLNANLGGSDFGLKLDPEIGTADSGSLERDLPDLLVSVGEAARAEASGIAILIDEIQYLSREDLSALIVAVHRVTQRQLPVIVMGAGLPSLPGLSGEAKSYAERLFRYPRIGALDPGDARAAFTEPAEKLGVSFNADALHEVVRITQGYPYFIQEWGRRSGTALIRPRSRCGMSERRRPRLRAAWTRASSASVSIRLPMRNNATFAACPPWVPALTAAATWRKLSARTRTRLVQSGTV